MAVMFAKFFWVYNIFVETRLRLFKQCLENLKILS